MPEDILRSRARTLSWLVLVPMALFVLLTVLVIGNSIWFGGRFADRVILWYLPMFLYIAAIWLVWRSLRAIARGEFFGKVVPAMLFRVGALLFCGALFNEVGRPLVTWLIYGSPWIRTFEASGVMLGVVGAALAIVAYLLKGAAEMRDELEGFL